MSYEPKPGSVAARAIDFLGTLPPGSEVMTTRLADGCGAEISQIQPCLEFAVQHQAVFRRQRDMHPRSPWWYSLTDHSNLPRQVMVALDIPKPPKAPPPAVVQLDAQIRAIAADAEKRAAEPARLVKLVAYFSDGRRQVLQA